MSRKRRGRGEGSMFQRADGLWCATISAGYAESGKRRRKTIYGKSKGEVQEKLRVTQNEITQGLPVETNRLTVGEYLQRWLDGTAKSTVAPTTWDRYNTVVKHQLKPYIGGSQLSKLQPVHIEQLYAQLEKAGESPRNRQLAGVVLGSALKHAIRLRLIISNPARDVPKPRVADTELKVWSAEQVSVFLKAWPDDRLHAMYVVALTSGLRQGELFGLQWQDIDFAADALSVQRSVEEIRGQLRLKEPKSGKGRRIDLPKFAIKALADHRAKMLAEGHIGCHVFCAPDGGLLRKGNVYRRSFLKRIAASAVPRIRFHDMRHTHATLLLLAGENVKVVSERLGHASIQITLDTYAHVLPSMQKAAAEKMQRLLG